MHGQQNIKKKKTIDLGYTGQKSLFRDKYKHT